MKRDHRGKGYGRKMVSFGLKKLIEARCKKAYLRVHVNNAAAIALYKSIGFDIVDNFQSLIWWSE
ncbi:MAG: GNAT family N-acetyltransferase [Candidatus Thorarchaeota archaeon]|nr:GNAT family N-acetyltransferase [Candidatus Thorarchaeota archaeon]